MPKLHGTQPGDPAKAVEVTIDLVKGEGVAEGREVPGWMPLGSDAFEVVKKKAEAELKLLGDWETVIKGTDFGVGK